MARGTRQRRVEVFVVAGHLLASEYLLRLLRHDPHLRPTRFSDRAVAQCRSDPCVFLLDSGMLPVSLPMCVSRLRLCRPEARFLVVAEEALEIHQMLEWGIHGCLRYSELARSLIPAVEAAGKGNTWFRPEALQKFMQQNLVKSNGHLGHKNLTLRENEIMDLLKKRMSNEEIASLLGIRISTVKFHVSNVLSKLGLTNRSDLFQKQNMFGGWLAPSRLVDLSHGRCRSR